MQPAFIGVDWGNSNGRFYLIADDATVIEQRSAPGIAKLDGIDAIEQACFNVIADWVAAYPALPVIMVGAVGSNIGWHMARYAATPATLNDVAANMLTFSARNVAFQIAPGLSTTRHDGLPDVLRSEEIQIFACAHNGATDEERLICLPGTHSKWAQVSDGAVTAFHSAHTGELLDIIGRYSILLAPKRPVSALPNAAFIEGIAISRDSILGLESLLFTVRSRQIQHALSADAADSYLAGLVIGCEVKSALALYGNESAVMLIGSPHLTALYAAALSEFGVSASQHDGDAASVSGLCKLYHAVQEMGT
jgi:2-dehydro-3-deoxygalactonokinase